MGVGPDRGQDSGSHPAAEGACAGVHVPHDPERGLETLCGGEGCWGPFGVSTILASHWGSWQSWEKTLAFLPE